MSKITKIVFSSKNAGKINEIRGILKDLGITIISSAEAGVTGDVVENGKTFAENALKKAATIGKITREWTIGDDTGICVVALSGWPGIYSARWAGENVTSEECIKLMLLKMKDVPEGQRQARFETAAVLRAPNGLYWTFVGRIDGSIALEARGATHPRLPYSSIFIPDGDSRTFSEMSAEEKNAISHRGHAFRKLKEHIERELV